MTYSFMGTKTNTTITSYILTTYYSGKQQKETNITILKETILPNTPFEIEIYGLFVQNDSIKADQKN